MTWREQFDAAIAEAVREDSIKRIPNFIAKGIPREEMFKIGFKEDEYEEALETMDKEQQIKIIVELIRNNFTKEKILDYGFTEETYKEAVRPAKGGIGMASVIDEIVKKAVWEEQIKAVISLIQHDFPEDKILDCGYSEDVYETALKISESARKKYRKENVVKIKYLLDLDLPKDKLLRAGFKNDEIEEAVKTMDKKEEEDEE